MIRLQDIQCNVLAFDFCAIIKHYFVLKIMNNKHENNGTIIKNIKASSHCTRLRPEVPINQWCRLRNVKSWNHFNFYDASTVYIGLPVVTRCATSAV